MRWVWLCLGLLLAGRVPAIGQASLASDARLQRPVSLWLKMTPLGDALKAIGRETGVSLTCSSTINQQKVAMFVRERPAHEVLTLLANTFRYEWRVREETNGYMLVVPDEVRRQEQSVSRALREARRAALQDLIEAARLYVPMTPEQRSQALRELERENDPASAPRRTQYKYVLSQLTGDYLRAEQTVLHCLSVLPAPAVNDLHSGRWVGLSTRPPRGIYSLPATVLAPRYMREHTQHKTESEGQKHYQLEPAPDNPQYTGIWLRLDPANANGIAYQIVTFTATTLLPLPDREQPLMRPPHPNLASGVLRFYLLQYGENHPYLDSWRAWATPRNQWAARLPERVQPDKASEPALPQYHLEFRLNPEQVVLTPADALERVAWLTGMPVIADAFRASRVYLPRARLRDPIALLEPVSHHTWLRFDDSGYLLARTRLYWAVQQNEFPEATLRALERKFKSGEWLSVDDYIDLVAQLTPEQIDALSAPDGRELVPLAEFPIETLAHNARVLRLLASFNTAQRKRLHAGVWIPASALSPPQRLRFQEAMEDFFPPVERLFVDAPDASRTAEHGILAPISSRLGILPPPEASDPPAIRLAQSRSYADLQGISSRGEFNLSGLDEAERNPEAMQQLRQRAQSMLERYPDAAFYRKRTYIIEIHLAIRPSYGRTYTITQTRLEAYRLQSEQ